MSQENATSAETEFDRYRVSCWDDAVHTLGTSYVFRQRARTLKNKLRILNYVGAAVPFAVGTLALTFGVFGLLKAVIAVAGSILFVQAVVNLWAIFGNWVDDYSYANASAAANDALSTRFHKLGANPPESLDDLKHEYEKLHVEDEGRRDQDTPHHVKDWEQRMGMRYALRKFRRPCTGCEKVPTSMQPTDCNVCGNFKYSDK